MFRSRRVFNPLNANPTKWSMTVKRFVCKLPTNCLSVFDHFLGLALKGLKVFSSTTVFHCVAISCVRLLIIIKTTDRRHPSRSSFFIKTEQSFTFWLSDWIIVSVVGYEQISHTNLVFQYVFICR